MTMTYTVQRCQGPGLMRYSIVSPAGMVEGYTMHEDVAEKMAAQMNSPQAQPATPVASADAPMPLVLFDGFRVLKAVRAAGNHDVNALAVTRVLDVIVDLARQDAAAGVG